MDTVWQRVVDAKNVWDEVGSFRLHFPSLWDDGFSCENDTRAVIGRLAVVSHFLRLHFFVTRYTLWNITKVIFSYVTKFNSHVYKNCNFFIFCGTYIEMSDRH